VPSGYVRTSYKYTSPQDKCTIRTISPPHIQTSELVRQGTNLEGLDDSLRPCAILVVRSEIELGTDGEVFPNDVTIPYWRRWQVQQQGRQFRSPTEKVDWRIHRSCTPVRGIVPFHIMRLRRWILNG